MDEIGEAFAEVVAQARRVVAAHERRSEEAVGMTLSEVAEYACLWVRMRRLEDLRAGRPLEPARGA